MKKIYLILLTVSIVLTNCGEYLDIVPDNVATIEYAFRDRVGAEKFLVTCYSYLPDFGHTNNDPTIMGSDEIWIHAETEPYQLGDFVMNRIKRSQQNVSSPLYDTWRGSNRGTNYFTAIRECNSFLENIDLVGPDLTEGEKLRWVAEIKFLKAYYHYYLLRMYGPIPLVKVNLPIDSETDEVRVYRDPFDECVDYIVQLIDEAVPNLPLTIQNVSSELGRITKTIALSIKAELLVMAASPLFNGNDAYSDFKDNKGTQLFNPDYDAVKWERAMIACETAIEATNEANIQLYQFNDLRYPLSEETRRLMSIRNAFGEKWNTEVIWGIPKNTTQNLQSYSKPYFTNDDIRYMQTNPILSPTLRMAELYYTSNGVPINEDVHYDYPDRFKTKVATGQSYYVKDGFETAILNQNREPRFYANLGFDGGIWFGNGRYKDVGEGTASETSWVIEAKAGQTSGKIQDIRFSSTGYFPKKYTHFLTESTSSGGVSYYRMSFPVMRLADLYLLYAEARNEFLGPDGIVFEYIDRVRNRAGLEGVVESWQLYSKNPNKPLNKEGLRDIIRQERMIELSFEGKRFWDIRRWKIADQILNQPIRGWNVSRKEAAEYYNIVTIENLEFQMKEYLWPISESALRENPNIEQNPFW